MVYPGARSTGCGQCRKRKIKCDEARPACRRCEKSGFECPGYYRPLELRFHADGGQLLPSHSRKQAGSGSDSTDTLSPAGFGPSAAPDGDDDDDTRCHRHRHHQALLMLPPPRLGQQLELLWEQESALYFFEEYCTLPSPRIFTGFLDFLPNIVLQSAVGSTLRAASTASACLALSRQSKSTQLYQRACAHYGKALRGLKTDLGSDASVIWTDETIVSIMLMSLFEDIHGTPLTNRTSHLTALVQIFSMRNITVLQTASLSLLYRWALLHIQIRSLYTGQTFDCVKVPKRDFSTEDLPSGLCLLVAQIGQFASAWIHGGTDADDRGHKRQPADPLALEEAWRIQTQLDLWMDNLPPLVKRRTVTTSRSADVMTAPTRMLGNVWSFFDAARIIFYAAMIACCRAEQELPTHAAAASASAETLLALASSRLTDSFDSICKSIRYNMGEVDEHGRDVASPVFRASVAYYIIPPLGLVLHSQYSSARHWKLCNEALDKIRSSHGLVHGDTYKEMLI